MATQFNPSQKRTCWYEFPIYFSSLLTKVIWIVDHHSVSIVTTHVQCRASVSQRASPRELGRDLGDEAGLDACLNQSARFSTRGTHCPPIPRTEYPCIVLFGVRAGEFWLSGLLVGVEYFIIWCGYIVCVWKFWYSLL